MDGFAELEELTGRELVEFIQSLSMDDLYDLHDIARVSEDYTDTGTTPNRVARVLKGAVNWELRDRERRDREEWTRTLT